MREYPAALTRHPPAGPLSLRYWVFHLRIPHRSKREQTRIAANRRLIAVGAYWSIRRPDNVTTFGPGLPGTLASRQARKNRNNTSVVTSGNGCSSTTSHRQHVFRPLPRVPSRPGLPYRVAACGHRVDRDDLVHRG